LGSTLAPSASRVPLGEIELAVRDWTGPKHPFLLVHGLASNARTWDGVARYLSEAGHRAVAVDQRGHGLSDKPDHGYGFEEVTSDLLGLIEALELQRPILAGQSWGGNVALEFAARYPQSLAGLVLVDGGFIDLSSAPGATWEKVSVDLRPPPLAGTPRPAMLERMRSFHPDWDDEAIEMQMGNFESLPDGTIRPWLTLDRHMQILRALWEHKPSSVYAKIATPTLIAVADQGPPQRMERKQGEVAEAEASIPRCRVKWFGDTAHDIHVHRPAALAGWMLEAVEVGYFKVESTPSEAAAGSDLLRHRPTSL
jgi:pimeloyl-ACP methyl ester carboxylesterase